MIGEHIVYYDPGSPDEVKYVQAFAERLRADGATVVLQPDYEPAIEAPVPDLAEWAFTDDDGWNKSCGFSLPRFSTVWAWRGG